MEEKHVMKNISKSQYKIRHACNMKLGNSSLYLFANNQQGSVAYDLNLCELYTFKEMIQMKATNLEFEVDFA